MVGMDHDLPSYSHSLRPTFLCLDGGGTRVVTQLYLLCEIMHRLAWDLKLISPKPSKGPRPQVSPADWFDYIGGGGTGSIVAYLLACGYSAEEARDKFVELSSTIVNDRSELGMKLEGLLPRHESMWWDGECIADLPARSNIWIASPENPERPHESQGRLIAAGTPITKFLLPLVLAEVDREITGKTEVLNYTLPFVQSVCPIFNECSMLLSLGSGDVPTPKSNTSPPSPLSSYNPLAWLTGSISPTTTTSSLPALPSSRATLSSIRALNKYIPTSAHGNSYIRLNPSLITWSTSGVQSWPSDWGCEKFGEHKMLISGFCSRYENGASMDCVVDVLKRRGLAAAAAGRRMEKEKMNDEKTEVKESMQKLLFASAGWY